MIYNFSKTRFIKKKKRVLLMTWIRDEYARYDIIGGNDNIHVMIVF